VLALGRGVRGVVVGPGGRADVCGTSRGGEKCCRYGMWAAGLDMAAEVRRTCTRRSLRVVSVTFFSRRAIRDAISVEKMMGRSRM
jgi:hypothetical protein